jgi:hypothetical protein
MQTKLIAEVELARQQSKDLASSQKTTYDTFVAEHRLSHPKKHPERVLQEKIDSAKAEKNKTEVERLE